MDRLMLCQWPHPSLPTGRASASRAQQVSIETAGTTWVVAATIPVSFGCEPGSVCCEPATTGLVGLGSVGKDTLVTENQNHHPSAGFVTRPMNIIRFFSRSLIGNIESTLKRGMYACT